MGCQMCLGKKKLKMRNTDQNIHDHPATDSVKNYLSGSERCIVVWGLAHSLTIACCQNIARGIINEKGLAKIFRCDEIARGHASLRQCFLDAVACKKLDDFVRYFPNSCGHAWLVFDAVDRLSADAIAFFQDLIQLSYESSKFKVLLFTHSTDIACSVLRWSDSHCPIHIVEPVGCCRWKASHLDKLGLDSNAMRLCERAGCPGVQDNVAAGDLEVRWTLGIARLTRFLREEWAPSGAFTASAERLARIA